MSQCNYENPSEEAMIAAKKARREAYSNAKSEDEQLAAAESIWYDYLPLCECEECTK